MTGLARLSLPFPQIAAGFGGLSIVLAGLVWLQGERMHRWKVDAQTKGRTLNEIATKTKATDRLWRTVEKQLAANASKIEKEKNDEISSIAAVRDGLLEQLRTRPGRGTATGAAPTAANGQAAGGSTGAQLYAEDAGFLVREAARADEIRVSLKACYAQYDDARAALAP